MKGVYSVLAIILLVLSENFASSFVLVPNANSKGDFEIRLLDIVFSRNDIEQNFNLTKDLENFKCFLIYELKNIEMMSQTAKRIRQCVDVSVQELQHYFKHHSWKHFKKHLLHDIRRCKTDSDNVDSYLHCLSDVVIGSFKEIKHALKHIEKETKTCIRSELKNFTNVLEENMVKLQVCLLENSYPPLGENSTESNTTFSPWPTTTLPNSTWQPSENSTQVPPSTNTTTIPNTTRNPLVNSTTISPILNSTSPLPNTTLNPMSNTTLPHSSINPLENSTTSAPIPNTTSSPYTTLSPRPNSTLNPWGNSTAVSPIVSTTTSTYLSTTLNPTTTLSPSPNTTLPNSTFNPGENITTSAPNTTSYPSTTRLSSTSTPSNTSTTVTPTVNTTASILPNTTLNPCENSTEILNTTLNPNTTSHPLLNSTSKPSENITTVSPIVNTSSSPYLNTTLNPSILQNSTLLPSTINTILPNITVTPLKATTLSAENNHNITSSYSTSSPVQNTTSTINNMTTTMALNSTTAKGEPALVWWDKIISIFH